MAGGQEDGAPTGSYWRVACDVTLTEAEIERFSKRALASYQSAPG